MKTFLFLFSLFVVLLLAGCSPGFSDISRQAGYRAPADFTRGVGEVTWTQSSDGRTVYWEVPFSNPTKNVMLATVAPSVNVKDDKGKILWTGNDSKSWSIPPGKQGYIGGKIEIPSEVLKPTLRTENGGATSATAER